jgi:anaerobic ribonucleoside-triphosphate reductase
MEGKEFKKPTPIELGKDVKFTRYRRITGYLSVLTQFCNAKQHEEHDRVKHA